MLRYIFGSCKGKEDGRGWKNTFFLFGNEPSNICLYHRRGGLAPSTVNEEIQFSILKKDFEPSARASWGERGM